MVLVRSLLAAGPAGGEGKVSRSLWTRSRSRRGRSQAWLRASRLSRVLGRSGAGGILESVPLPRPARAHECIGSGAGGWDAAHPSVCRTDVHMSRVGASARSHVTRPPRCVPAATVRPACALEGARRGVHLWVEGWAPHAHACIDLPAGRRAPWMALARPDCGSRRCGPLLLPPPRASAAPRAIQSDPQPPTAHSTCPRTLRVSGARPGLPSHSSRPPRLAVIESTQVAQNPGEANIHKVNLQLPLALPSRLTTLQKACTASQFESNPAGCPEASFVGTAVAHTPILNVPLTGPAILVSHGGAAFPDLVLVLQGEGVRIDLVGNTEITKGRTYSRFETVPDAPVTSFDLTLPEGPHSVLATNLPASAKYNFCGQTLTMPTTITGQNGAQVTQSTNIAVTGCGKPSIKITKAKIKGNTVLVTVTTTQQGTVTVSGRGLKTIKKTLAAGAHQLKVSLTNNGRTARKHHKKTKVKASVKDSNGSSSKTMNLKL